MAVYTSITKETLISFLNNYDIGILKNFEGILEGVENTNYKINPPLKTTLYSQFLKKE